MKAILLAWVCLLSCLVVSASAGSLDELTPYLSGVSFRWKENQNSRRILEESGGLAAAGIIVRGSTDSSLTLSGKSEIFGGEVDYDGETQAPESVPARTDVTYLGMNHQFDLGCRLFPGKLRVDPFAGIGYRMWIRDLQSGTDVQGNPFSGYTEFWQTVYGRLGGRGWYKASPDLAFFGESGFVYPFYTGNSIDFAGSGTVTLHPRGGLSGFAEAGAQWKQLRMAVYYEGFRWSRSPVKTAGNSRIFQPDSAADSYGLSLGWAFR